jgi:hypothetical protein
MMTSNPLFVAVDLASVTTLEPAGLRRCLDTVFTASDSRDGLRTVFGALERVLVAHVTCDPFVAERRGMRELLRFLSSRRIPIVGTASFAAPIAQAIARRFGWSAFGLNVLSANGPRVGRDRARRPRTRRSPRACRLPCRRPMGARARREARLRDHVRPRCEDRRRDRRSFAFAAFGRRAPGRGGVMCRELFDALQEAAELCRSLGAVGQRTRRLVAEIDLLRAAVAVSAVEPAPDEDLGALARLVFGVRDEALELERSVRLAREAATMMD